MNRIKWFLIFMIILTFLSAKLKWYTTPEVVCVNPKPAVLEETYTCYGYIQEGEVVMVTLPEKVWFAEEEYFEAAAVLEQEDGTAFETPVKFSRAAYGDGAAYCYFTAKIRLDAYEETCVIRLNHPLGSYAAVLPSECIQSNPGAEWNYVYVAESTENPFRPMILRKVNVQIEKVLGENTAVTGLLSADSLVVRSYSRPIKSDILVRLGEE